MHPAIQFNLVQVNYICDILLFKRYLCNLLNSLTNYLLTLLNVVIFSLIWTTNKKRFHLSIIMPEIMNMKNKRSNQHRIQIHASWMSKKLNAQTITILTIYIDACKLKAIMT